MDYVIKRGLVFLRYDFIFLTPHPQSEIVDFISSFVKSEIADNYVMQSLRYKAYAMRFPPADPLWVSSHELLRTLAL